MTVSETIRGLHTTPFISQDQRYPIFRFVMNGVVAGDATGGIVQMTFELRPSGQPLSGQIFGIRRVNALALDATVGDCAFEVFRTTLIEDPLEDEVLSIFMDDVAITGSRELWDSGKVDMLIGRPSTLAANTAGIFFWESNVDTVSYRAQIEGFVWQPRALFEGGPLFPGEWNPP